jgi:hypothetical protein
MTWEAMARARHRLESCLFESRAAWLGQRWGWVRWWMAPGRRRCVVGDLLIPTVAIYPIGHIKRGSDSKRYLPSYIVCHGVSSTWYAVAISTVATVVRQKARLLSNSCCNTNPFPSQDSSQCIARARALASQWPSESVHASPDCSTHGAPFGGDCRARGPPGWWQKVFDRILSLWRCGKYVEWSRLDCG